MEREELGINIKLGGEGGGEDLGKIIGGEKYDQSMLYEKFQRKVKRNIYGEFWQTSGKTCAVGKLKMRGLRTAKGPARAVMTMAHQLLNSVVPTDHTVREFMQSPLWTLDHACIFRLSLFHRTHAPISQKCPFLSVSFFSPLLFPF